MKRIEAIAEEILAEFAVTSPGASEGDRASLKSKIVVILTRDRVRMNNLIQAQLKIPQYAMTKLFDEVKKVLLSDEE